MAGLSVTLSAMNPALTAVLVVLGIVVLVGFAVGAVVTIRWLLG